MLDLSLLKSPSFLLLASSGFLTMMGFFVPFMFMPDRALQEMDKGKADYTISVIGISNTIARSISIVFQHVSCLDKMIFIFQDCMRRVKFV